MAVTEELPGESQAPGGQGPAAPLVVALAGRSDAPEARELAGALAVRGHRVVPLRGAPGAAAAVLSVRKFDPAIADVPALALALRGRFDVVHAYSPAGAVAASLAGARPVLTFPRPVIREELSHLRLRLVLLERAIGASAAIVAPSEAVLVSLRRWLAVDAVVLAPGDGAGHEALYRTLRQPPVA